MALRPGKRAALREAVLWVTVIGAGFASFTYFEIAYQALHLHWRQVQAFIPAAAELTALKERPGKPPGAPPGKSIASEHAISRGPESGVTAAAPAPAPLSGIEALIAAVTGSGQKPQTPKSVLLQANQFGHFHAEAAISGHRVEFLTDTGATYVALNYETAARLGFGPHNLKFSGRSSTANGIARVAPVTLPTVRIGGIVIRNVAAVVAEPGKMSQNLLGMSFINRLSRFELQGQQLTLIQ